jgi:hypothetical protein
MFQSLDALVTHLADRVTQNDESLPERLGNIVSTYFASIGNDENRYATEREALATAYGDKLPLLRTALSEKIFKSLELYSLGRKELHVQMSL